MICVGDIALVSENPSRSKWKHGLVEKLLRGARVLIKMRTLKVSYEDQSISSITLKDQ